MTNLPGQLLQLSINKGFRPINEAMKDDKYLRENESTGINWSWKNRNNEQVIFGTTK